ncbi:CGNR zinc finger domain-containing protein [Pontibacillus salicampi]|uniref:CGNR zinc finger domain-containing protein n=1 Tax=Pontibacillus salicampi TaxID=1449801 RepID=A0ABV6LIW9_9BACI
MTKKMTFSHFSTYLFINFLNTIKMDNNKKGEQLNSEEDIWEWLLLMQEHGLLQPSQVTTIKQESIDVEKVRNFRDVCRNYFYHLDNKQEWMNIMMEHTMQVPLSFVMEQEMVAIPSKGGTMGLISLLSFDLLQKEQDGIVSKVKACENNQCLALFVNNKGKRKWCSMEVCGNRAKAKKHYYSKTNKA